MGTDRFPEEVVEALRCYVYRLIDPRNGETFYVGRGRKQRVFAHASGDNPDQSAADPKLARIREIRALGMDVAHVIHRHGMSDAAAKEVEAALIDAYPGLVNKVAGSGSDRGTRHVDEIMLEYSAKEFVVEEPLILISIGQTWKERGVYEAVRGVWRMDIVKAKRYKLVLAHSTTVGIRGEITQLWAGPTGDLHYQPDPDEPAVLTTLREAIPEETVILLNPLPYSRLQ